MSSRTSKDSAGQSRELFLTLQKPQRDAIRTLLLQGMAAPSVVAQPSLRNKVGDAVAEIARQYTDEQVYNEDNTRDTWADLLAALFQASQSPDAGQRETAFRIFATTPGIIEKQHEEVVLSSFTKGFKDDDVAVSSFLQHCLGRHRLMRVWHACRSGLPPWTHLRPSSTRSPRKPKSSITP